jgi:tRNA A37 threonylcarbamoyltransferase TsaD
VVNGRTVLSNEISSQIDIHTLYGGVVPEIASRKHIERINQVIRKALSTAGKTLQDIDAIAVTYGPGLVGALLTGVSAAKAISFAADIPLIGRLFTESASEAHKDNLIISVSTRLISGDGIPVRTNTQNGLPDFRR